MARFQVSSWAFIAIVANFVFWLVAAGGVSAVTYECQKEKSSAHCARGLQFEWYSVVLQLVLLVLLLGVGYSSNFLRYKLPVVAFLVLATGMLSWSARSFMVGESDAVGQDEGSAEEAPDLWSRATMNAAAAGYVMLCLVNYVLIWLYGSAEPVPSQLQFQKEAMMTSSGPVQV